MNACFPTSAGKSAFPCKRRLSLFNFRLKMYRAIYSYEGQQEHTLDFIEDDQFTVMDTRDQYWWLVQNGFGEIGYVPANYLEADEVGNFRVDSSF